MASSIATNRIADRPLSRWSWLPLAALPISVGLLTNQWPAWVFMWLLAFSIYAGLKLLAFVPALANGNPPWRRQLGFLLLWPGMDAKSFLDSARPVESPVVSEWAWAGAKMVLGALLIAGGASLADDYLLLGGCIGFGGILVLLHFGLFHLLSCGWRSAGVDARPIMNAPILASSLSDFWGSRWNLAFRDLAHGFVFRPLVGRWGIAGATMSVFFVSGILHDIAISIPARGGWGLPTVYFLLQGIGVLFERSAAGRRTGLGRGWTGRLFCAAVVLGPVLLLFHPPFIERVAVPMLGAVRHATGGW